jgi:hypothetical protein
MSTVTRLDVDVDGVEHCQKFDVFFNGKKQSQCLIADATRGYIKRYRTLWGKRVIDRHQRPMLEELRGKVEIIPKSQPEANLT